MIKSIELKNWKTHKDTKLDFSKGANILIGQMGSGKSSIMDAISYALFGTFPSIQHRRVNVNKIVRNKPLQQKHAHVKLEFELDGINYIINREITFDEKAIASATLEKDGSYLQSQPQRVTEEVERILKVDYDIFSKVVYSEQNGLDYFLDLNPTLRKKQIDGLLGLDKFALAQENTTILMNRIKDIVADTQRIASEFDLPKAKEDLESLSKEKVWLHGEKEGLEHKLTESLKLKTKSEAKLNSIKEDYVKKQLLAKEMEGLKSKSTLLENEIKKIESKVDVERNSLAKDLEKQKADIEKLKKEDSGLSDSERKHNSIIAKLDADINNSKKDEIEKEKLTKKISGMKKSDIAKSITQCNEEIELLSSSHAQANAKATEAEVQIKELEKHISTCPICEREIDDDLKARLLHEKKKLIEESKKNSSKYHAQIEKSRSELKELNAQFVDFTIAEEKLKGYLGISEKLDSYKKSLTEAKIEYEKIKSAKDRSAKTILMASESIQKLNSTIETIDRRDRYLSEKKTADENLTKKTSEFNKIAVEQKEIDTLQEEFITINSDATRFKANIDASKKYIADKELQIKEKSFEIERINRINEEAGKKREVVENLSKFKASLFETQAMLRTQLITSINGIMHEVWKNLYPYADYQSLTLDASEDDYRLKVKTLVNNEYVWEDVQSIASGGEKSTASLAMRIAFSLVLVPNLKWLILDEPTHNIDREGLTKFVQVFGDTLPNIIDQVFIITHDEILKQVNGAKIYSFSRNKEENKETEVTQIS